MTRSGDKKPAPAASPRSEGARSAKPGRSAGTEAFGRFVRTLSRLETGPGPGRKGKETGR